MKDFNSETPYNELPKLPPNIDLETPQILKKCIEAHKGLAKLKIAEKLIPNQAVLINSIPLLESRASSAIENIVTTTDELFEHSQGSSIPMNSATKETLQYRQALYLGYTTIKNRPLTIPAICEICSTIRRINTQIRNFPGTALINESTGEKIYTPPEDEEKLNKLLYNWLSYLHMQEDKTDPLIKLAVQHYQFEAIHPFSDGNGRTGRIINLLYLIQQELLDTPILYLSGYIIKNKENYYKKILKVTTEGAWHEWILYILEALCETSKWTLSKILAIQELIEKSSILIKSKAPSLYSRELVELLFTHPYSRIQDLVGAENIGRDTAAKRLQKLCEIGFLESTKRGKSRLFINHQFLNLLRRQ